MSERADDDVRGEQRRAARQPKQQQQQGEASTAMATVGERRSLPSPENMLGQPWSNWVDAAKLHGKDGADSEESLKECAKNREAMRLSRDDMPIFGQCPAQDDFYLVICSHCSQVVKPQAFQAHYDRRHGSASKPHFSTVGAPAAYSSPASARTGGGGAPGGIKILKPAKDKPPVHRRPLFPFKVLPDKIPTSAPKLAHNPASSTTVSTPLKPGLNCPSIPKAPLMSPGQIPNGKGLSLDKKQDSNASNRRQLHKRLPEREFNPDVHCGVLDLVTRKPCTRSLTCKTHSLSQRRAVLGRRKRLDVLLAEHKSRARERERERDHPPPVPSLRDPHSAPEHQQVSHSNGTAHTKAATPSKPKPHNPGLPRLNSSNAHPSAGSQGDPSLTHGSPHRSGPTVPTDKTPRLSSDEGENEEREEGLDKLDYLYSGYHPRPASLCTFGSRQLGRSCYTFSRRWDRVRCALLAMVDKHVNSQMWKRIPPAPENASSAVPHRISGSAPPASSHPGFLCPAPAASSAPYPPSFDGRPVLSYGTTLNARASPLSSGDRPACGAQSRQVSSSSSSPSPQMPSGLSALPSPFPSRSPKSRPSSKAFRSKESPASGGHFNSGVVGGEVGSGKKRKNSSPLRGHPPFSVESSPSFSLKKNCAANSGGSGSAYHPSLTFSTTTSSSSSSSSSSSHGAGLNCAPSRTGSLGLKHEQSGRGPPSGSPAESIKRMSVVMNSSDSTLSLGPFVHQPVAVEPGGPTQDGRLEGRKRKGSPATGGLHAGPGSGRPKVVRPPSINNVHGKHGRPVPGTQGLPNNSLLQQPKARP